jgi:hypothetical protein
MKVKDLIKKLLEQDGDATVYVLAHDDDHTTWYKEANVADFDVDGVYILHDEQVENEKNLKEISELQKRLDQITNESLSLSIITDLDEMSDLIEEAKDIISKIKYLESEIK